MNGFTALVISGLIVAVGMLLYPSVHSIIGGIDISTLTPLVKAEVVGTSYAFLAIVGYIVLKMWRRS